MKRECIPCSGSHHQKSCFKSKRKHAFLNCANICALAYKFENTDIFNALDLYMIVDFPMVWSSECWVLEEPFKDLAATEQEEYIYIE